MLTFVINLHTGIPSMALAEPFLYPLQKNETLHLIFSTTDSVARRLEDAAMKVRQHLERSAYFKWQVVFLVKIAPDQAGAFQDSLSAQMSLIKQLFLQSPHLNLRPHNNFIIALDHLNEDEAIPALQVSENYRDSWELDTTGIIRNANRYFINETQMQQLDSIWKQNATLDQNTIINLGFNRLPADIQNKVNNATQQITQLVNGYIDVSKSQFQRFSIVPNVYYIDEKSLERVQNAFNGRLESTKQDPSRYNEFLPSEALKSSIADIFGIFSEENQSLFRLIRYPLSYSHEDILQQHLVKLALVISLITEEEEIIKALSRKNYTVKADIKPEAVQQIMGLYTESLHNAERRLSDRLSNPLPVSLELLESTNCGCTETLEKSAPPKLQLGFVLTQGDLPKWDDWNATLYKQVTDYSILAQRKIQHCISQGQRQMQTLKTMEVTNIDNTVQDLANQRSSLQQAVQHQFFTKSFTYDWNTYRKEQERNFKPLLFSRPTQRTLIYLLLITSVLTTLGFVNVGLKNQDGGTLAIYYIGALVIAALLGALVFWIARNSYRKKIDDILLSVYEKARALRSTIHDDFERQKNYLTALCQLNVVRHNYDKAVAARDQRNEQNVMMDFHRRKLAEHKSIAQNLLRVFRATMPSQSSTGLLPDITPIDVTRAVADNDIYAPNTYMNIRSQGTDVSKVENTPYPIQSNLKHLLNNLVFDRDKIYNRPNR